MISSLAATVGLVLQAAGNPHAVRAARVSPPDPVRVWRSDSSVYVQLRDPGHVLLLHVDAIGRIRVLFPQMPDDSTGTSAEATVAISVPPEAQGNPATFVAVRSRWAFTFADLRAGAAWDYQDAWLLQPTGGDPLAALLDIADRVTDGRPYDFGVVAYAKSGAVASRRTPQQPAVCLGCVRRGAPAVEAAAAVPTNAVDCSNASMTNSFCGVNSGSVSISSAAAPGVAYQPPAAPAAVPVYVPYYVPLVVHGARRRFEPPPLPAPMQPASQGVAYPIAPRLVVPSPSQLRSLGHRGP